MATKECALFCVICQCKDINKSAQEYCPQCEETLCGDCRANHKISRLSKSHQTISIENLTNYHHLSRKLSITARSTASSLNSFVNPITFLVVNVA